jgi:WD40 repeat protein
MVHAFDTKTGSWLNTIRTQFDFGGKRIAVDEAGLNTAVGSFGSQTIALFSICSGTTLWSRKIGKVHSVRFSTDGEQIYCCAGAQCHIVDAVTGRLVDTLRRATGVWENPFKVQRIIEREDRLLFDGKRVSREPVIDLVFSPRFVCFSESGGPVRCLDSDTGNEVWSYKSHEEEHALTLGFNARLAVFTAVFWPYVSGGNARLILIAEETGAAQEVYQFPKHHFVFASNAELLVSTNGEIIDVCSGEILRTLQIPSVQ